MAEVLWRGLQRAELIFGKWEHFDDFDDFDAFKIFIYFNSVF